MPIGALRVRRVRNYRRPRYPDRWVPGRRARRRARKAGIALAVPIAAGGCWWSEGEDGGIRSPVPSAILAEDEGEAILERVITESDFGRADTCPTVAERLIRDAFFRWDPGPGSSYIPVTVEMDFLAPAETVTAFDGCDGGEFPAVGLSFGPIVNDPAFDPISVQGLYNARMAALRLFGDGIYTFPYEAESGEPRPYGSSPRFSSKEAAEEALEADVRAFVEELRRDGFL